MASHRQSCVRILPLHIPSELSVLGCGGQLSHAVSAFPSSKVGEIEPSLQGCNKEVETVESTVPLGNNHFCYHLLTPTAGRDCYISFPYHCGSVP